MLVSQILKAKAATTSATGIISISPEAKVADAAELLAARRIGALVVSQDGVRANGILSERDIVRELGKKGPESLEAKVSSIMTVKLVTCAPGDTTLAVLEKMTEGRFRHMPVLEGEEMVGLISIGDVVKARLDELHAEKDALEGMIKGY